MFSSNIFIVSDACAYIVQSADCNRTNYEISVIPRCLQKQGKWNRRIKKHTLSNTNIHEHRLCDYIILHIEILPSFTAYISFSVCACVCLCMYVCALAHVSMWVHMFISFTCDLKTLSERHTGLCKVWIFYYYVPRITWLSLKVL